MNKRLKSHFETRWPRRPLHGLTRAAVTLGVCLSFAATLSADSLWQEGRSKSMCADKRASRVGDIVTILVQENSTASKDNSTKTSKQSDVNAAVATFLYGTAATSLLSHQGSMPALKFSGTSDFTGSGAINNSQKIDASVAVRIVDVLPNDNLVIEGTRESSFSGETQTILLRGTIRQDDISALNTVLSFNVADATIKFVSKGPITDAQRKGWFQRLWDKFSPF
jgi:flagellar L-ring protein precursor FlgH